MASAFIGLTMLVTLNSPPGAQLRGTVSSVEPGQSLTLRNVTNPKNGMYLPEFTIRAVEITELVEDNSGNIAPVAATPPPDILPQKKKTFEDPAILSMGRRPTPSQTMSRSGSARTSRAPEELAAGANPPPNVVEIMRRTTLQEKPAAVPLQIPDELDTAAEVLPEQPLTKTRNGAKSRRKKGRNAKIEDSARDPEVIPAKETTRSKGWRQTPLLEPNPSFQPFSTLRRQKGRASGKTEENGWQTEDATDVQDMGDFDFASSLAKFDKQTVFQHLQEEDGIAAEDRLVAHNRLPKFKPGTSRGKNLHHTENVLDTPNGAGASKVHHELWTSEDETKEPLGGTGSGRQSRRAESRVAIHRKPTSRKGSSVKGATIVAPQLTRANTLNNTTSKSSFFLREFDRRCETISALQMLNLENIADNEVGLSEDMMSENAGRGIAEVAISALNPGVSGLVQGKTTTPPTVVVFAGNNKNGLRAVAAGRHLRNHGFSVITCVLGLEREAELLVGLRRQLKVFRGFGGKLVTKNELLELVKALPLPIDLIIDGLLGLTMSFEELRTGDQATVYELIEWANRSTASVLAIDVPTGIDPTTGKINIIDGRQLYIHSKYIVAMGAPKKGLLEAMALGEGVSNEDGLGKGKEWQLFVADLGLGTAVWKKAGTKIRRGVEFEGSWVLGMRFQPGSE